MIQCSRGLHFFFFLISFWELKVQRSGNESILLLWCPAKWTSCISSQWSIERGGLSISSMTYRALSMCVAVPALPHTHRTQPEPLSWGWAAFLTLGLNTQGKTVGGVGVGNKNTEQVKLLWDILPFVFQMSYMLDLLLFVCQLPLPQNSWWHNFTTANKPIY